MVLKNIMKNIDKWINSKEYESRKKDDERFNALVSEHKKACEDFKLWLKEISVRESYYYKNWLDAGMEVEYGWGKPSRVYLKLHGYDETVRQQERAFMVIERIMDDIEKDRVSSNSYKIQNYC